ncbi:hypothetical protein [Riemerella columbipharyngis]|uniref:Uncharacterized protein n=1 Tax=Riemerella columbipharyngis TaxID=1071918 RepID=A0A1G7FE17_9FLAO|nr:hypothetical protein [Riemerella columbipharyngis]SDE74122.1 hypothetical protein SAMN05421544_1228 [Riemerella columbipharyngis]
MLPNESVAKSVALNVANEMCKKSNTLENTDTMQLQDLKEHLQDSKDHINTLKERVAALIKDKERLQQEKDNWEHRYNVAQAEIQQLKNMLSLGDTRAGEG